jgi:tRNA pseudouridine(38-40) synthase
LYDLRQWGGRHVTELEKMQSREWRVNHLYSIVDKSQQQIRFKQNPIQRAVFRTQNKWKMVLKARQFGVSTNEIIDIFDDTIWKPNQTNAIIAHEKDSIVKLFRIVQRAWKFLPEDARPVLDRGGGSKYEMYFPEINSRIYCDLEIRSDTVSRLLVSEAAFFNDPLKLVATLQAVPIHCPVTLESTPNGVDSFFYEWWNDPASSYAKLFFPWYIFPEYQMSPGIPMHQWTPEERKFAKRAMKMKGGRARVITPEQMAFRRHKKRELRHLFIQEYPEDDQTCFLSSGLAAMDLLIVSALLKAAPPPIEETEDGLKIHASRSKPVFDVDTVLWIHPDLDVDAMRAAAKAFVGRHDFTTFSALTDAAENRIRTIRKFFIRRSGDRIVFDIVGDAFLQHQIRIMVGTLIEIGKGRRPASDVRRLLKARNRLQAGRTAAPHGLTLLKVYY